MGVAVWRNISVLRGIAMCFVVAIHAARKSHLFFPFDTIHPFEHPMKYTVLLVIESLSPFCLPAFLFASGFTYSRMFTGWKSMFRAASQVLKKYLLWAIPLYLVFLLIDRKPDLMKMAQGLVLGGPMPAYWFLVLIVILYIVASPWITFIKVHPRFAIISIICIQIMVWFYPYQPWSKTLNPFLYGLFVRPLIFLPPFVAGMLVASYPKKVIYLAEGRRYYLAIGIIVTVILCFVESSFLGMLDSWKTDRMSFWFKTERFSLTLFSIVTILYIITSESEKTRLNKWFSDIGLASLGILLLMDLFQLFLTYILWHVPSWIYPSPYTSYVIDATHTNIRQEIPLWLQIINFWVIPFYFLIGLFGPLYFMKITKKIIGNRTRLLW